MRVSWMGTPATYCEVAAFTSLQKSLILMPRGPRAYRVNRAGMSKLDQLQPTALPAVPRCEAEYRQS